MSGFGYRFRQPLNTPQFRGARAADARGLRWRYHPCMHRHAMSLLLALLLAACGQKGPLYLPDAAGKTRAPATTPAPAAAPAAGQEPDRSNEPRKQIH